MRYKQNRKMKLIYFHGFGSSAASGTVNTLRQELPGFEVVAPDMKVGKFEYYKPLLDGKKEFIITEEIIRHFAEMESHQFDSISPEEQEKVWGMFGDSDTQVNCEEEFLRHYHNVVHFKGGHRLDNAAIKEVLIPLIHLLA